MARWLRIENNVASNAEEWTEQPPSALGLYVQSDTAHIGATYDPATGTLTNPASVTPVPTVISMMQAQLELHATASPTNAGKTCLDDVNAAVAAATDASVAIYWKTAADLHRTHPKLLALATALGWSSDFVDQLFISAAQQS